MDKQFKKFWNYLDEIEKDEIEQNWKDDECDDDLRKENQISIYDEDGNITKGAKEWIIAVYREEILNIVKLKVLRGLEDEKCKKEMEL